MTRLERFLDTVHEFSAGLANATRRKKKWDRERLTSTMKAGVTILSAVTAVLSMAFPHLRGVATAANVVGAVQNVVQDSPPPEPVRAEAVDVEFERKKDPT